MDGDLPSVSSSSAQTMRIYSAINIHTSSSPNKTIFFYFRVFSSDWCWYSCWWFFPQQWVETWTAQR